MDLINEVSEFCTPTLNSLLFGNLALSDEANELIFKSVHKFIRRSKRFEHTEYSDYEVLYITIDCERS